MSKISKLRIINAITTHPKLVTFGIGFAITFGVTIVTGFANMNQVFAYPPNPT